MKVLSFALVLGLAPVTAAAEAPTLWNCLGETRFDCRGADCAPAEVVEVVQVSLLTWTNERCAIGCISGRSSNWVEDASGSVIVIADDYPQHLVLGPDNVFTDVATVGETTTITRGQCFPALKDQATSLTLLDIYHQRQAFLRRYPRPPTGPSS